MRIGRWIWFSLGLAGVLFVAGLLNGFLASLYVHAEFQPKVAASDSYGAPETAPKGVVGLALSGGGARAAVFGAAGMQALAERGLLGGVTHVSSVSGGGFAASYLATHPLPECSKATDRKVCFKDYFAAMQIKMQHNYLWDTEVGQVTHPRRIFSPSRRILSLQEALEAPDYLQGKTFGSITDGRAYFFNAVSYDTGQRFVFSNVAVPDPLDASPHLLPASVRSRSFSDATTPRPTPSTEPLSLAVATSAAFPPYLGPTTIAVLDKDKKPKQYWHLGDGGIFENTGGEMLREVILSDVNAPPATIYLFDAGQKLDKDESENTLDISIWSRQVTRLVDVIVEYAGGHRTALSARVIKDAGLSITEFPFDYLDAARILATQSAPTSPLSSWDNFDDCNWWETWGIKTPADHLKDVPTSLRITKCNAALMMEAAEFLVEQRFPHLTYD